MIRAENRSRCSGFSLVELMVAMVAVAVMALTVGSVLYYAWVGWSRGRDSVKMQRDVSLAMRMLAKEIRASNPADVEVGSSLKCSNATFSMSDDRLIYRGMNLIEEGLNDFSSSATPSNVTVKLSVNIGYDGATVNATYYMRN